MLFAVWQRIISAISETSHSLDIISDDAYWQGAVEMPRAKGREGCIDGFSSVKAFATYGAAKVIGLYEWASSNEDELDIEPISEGEDLPVVARGEGLIRIVQDRRKPESRLRRAKWREKYDDSPERFEQKARRMEEDLLYHADNAHTTVEHPETQRLIGVWRNVLYLTGSKSGAQLEGIPSYQLFKGSSNVQATVLLPSVTVGTPYKENRRGNVTSKVVAATVLRR